MINFLNFNNKIPFSLYLVKHKKLAISLFFIILALVILFAIFISDSDLKSYFTSAAIPEGNAQMGTVIYASEDTLIKSKGDNTENKNYSSVGHLRIRNKKNEIYSSLIKFNTSTVSYPVDNAFLRLFMYDGSPATLKVSIVDNNWEESTVTWNTKPATILDSISQYTGDKNINRWIEFNITSAVNNINAKELSFLIESIPGKDSSNSFYFYPKEKSNGPELVVNGTVLLTGIITPTTTIITPTTTPNILYPTTTPGQTTPTTTPIVYSPTITPGQGDGIWISKTRLNSLPMSGPGWEVLVKEAGENIGNPDLSDQNNNANVIAMAKALVAARTGNSLYTTQVQTALQQIVSMGKYEGRALALGRELGAFVLAADLINLKTINPALDGQFRTKIRELLTTPTTSGPKSLKDCHEMRPNNWGTMCGGTRIAIAAYLGDRVELERAANVFRGWVGETNYYNGFKFGDLSWQCDEKHPVGINPRGCVKYGHNIGGAPPDDARRAGKLTPGTMPKSGYVWGALEGAIVQAIILQQMGYNAFSWGDQAICRLPVFNTYELKLTARESGDDVWSIAATDYYCGTSLWDKKDTSGAHGKIAGWTMWTHQK